MDVLQIIIGILSGGAVAGVISIYNAKANKTSIEAETFKKFFDEVQEWCNTKMESAHKEIEELKAERAEAKADSQTYRETTDEKIETLYANIHKLEESIIAKECAINSAYRCPLPKSLQECPVLETIAKAEKHY